MSTKRKSKSNGGTTAQKQGVGQQKWLGSKNQWHPKGVAKGGDNTKSADHKMPASKAQREHKGEHYDPGKKSTVIEPYMNAEDLMNYAQRRQEYEDSLHESAYNYETSAINTAYEEGNIAKGARDAQNSSEYNFAGRGLGHSSIRDADLFDIQATASLKKTYLDSQLHSLKLNTEAKKTALESNWGTYEKGLNQKMVQNAEEANTGLPEYEVQPGWVKNTPTPSVPKPPAKPKKPNIGLSPASGLQTSGGQALNPATPAGNGQGNGGTTASRRKQPRVGGATVASTSGGTKAFGSI